MLLKWIFNNYDLLVNVLIKCLILIFSEIEVLWVTYFTIPGNNVHRATCTVNEKI
jgi:hypothetical protein